jgi:site-specific recombinase XerC
MALSPLRLQPLWDELIEPLEASSSRPERIQDRVALSMMLLTRRLRVEASGRCRRQRIALLRNKWSSEVFDLTVLDKRNVYRVVPVSSRTVEALRHYCKDPAADRLW